MRSLKYRLYLANRQIDNGKVIERVTQSGTIIYQKALKEQNSYIAILCIKFWEVHLLTTHQ